MPVCITPHLPRYLLLPTAGSTLLRRLPPSGLPYRSQRRMLVMYFVSAVAGTVASLYGSPNLSLGASAAIFGMGGAIAVHFYTNR